MAEPSFPIGLMLERTAQFLEKQVAPALSDRMLVHKTTTSAGLLHLLAVTVEEKSDDLAEENDAMRRALKKVLEVLEAEKSLALDNDRNALAEKIKGSVGRPAPNLSDEHLKLKKALVDTIKGLDALSDRLPAEAVSSLRKDIRAAMRLQLNHSLARLASLRASRG